ncbi:putative tansposase [Escherichia coli]|nr:putative tansposase [Escherichia coli]CAD5731314.1 putative tansposase [Escherichia coli]CAD5746573.1 putative tansposase [Escherichia coli]
MRNAHFTEHEIIAAIKLAKVGRTVKDVFWEDNISEDIYYVYGLPSFCKH